jgi:hypothetical protein
MTWPWRRYEPTMLCRYMRSEAKRAVAPEVNPLDYVQREDGITDLVRDLYAALLSRKINYALEPVESSVKVQEIRTPEEILDTRGEGTCIDLSLLFCGICLGCDLLPVLVVQKGHALVAVSLKYTMRDWRRRGENKLFENVVVAEASKGERLVEIIKSKAYLPVECTGFAVGKGLGSLGDKPESCGRGADGTMTFERAVEAGSEQFDSARGRAFDFALDVATWQNDGRASSSEEAERLGGRIVPAGRLGSALPSNPLPYLLDRSNQEEALRAAVFTHREWKPQRPLVCVVHGNMDEYHAAFLDRLEEESLPPILRLWHPEQVAQATVERCKLSVNLSKVTEENYVEVFRAALKKALFDDKPASNEDVVNLISKQKLAVIIDLPLLSEQLEDSALGALDLFLKFWDGWEKLSDRVLLIVCLCLRYQPAHDSRRRFFGLLKGAGLNEEIRRYVEELDFSTYPNLVGVCLPELLSIRQPDAEEAVDRPPVKARYNVTQAEVIMMYRDAPRTGIPMLSLLEKFKPFLKATP